MTDADTLRHELACAVRYRDDAERAHEYAAAESARTWREVEHARQRVESLQATLERVAGASDEDEGGEDEGFSLGGSRSGLDRDYSSVSPRGEDWYETLSELRDAINDTEIDIDEGDVAEAIERVEDRLDDLDAAYEQGLDSNGYAVAGGEQAIARAESDVLASATRALEIVRSAEDESA